MTFAITGLRKDSHFPLELPMRISIAPFGHYQLTELSLENVENMPNQANGDTYLTIMMVGERAVDPSRILSVEDIFEIMRPDGSTGRGRALTSPDVYELVDGAGRIGGAIIFSVGVALSVMPATFDRSPNHYIAETADDERLLDSHGTDTVRLPLVPTTHVEVSDLYPVDAQLIQELAQRGAVSIYGEVLTTQTSVGKFRELWRTLELAFQAHGTRLIDLLSKFPPAGELGFDRDELEALLILRGKVSHAASRGGTATIAQFEAEVLESIGRLWSLVDRVLLTKKESSRSLDVEELRPLTAYVARDGTIEFNAKVTDRKRWFDFYSVGSSRFRQPES